VKEHIYDKAMAKQQERLAATSDMMAQRRFLMDRLALQAGECVLDIGSGSGIFVREAMEFVGADGRACGVDSSGPMVELAGHLCPEGQFFLGDAVELPFQDESFDAVTAAQLLCFVPDVARALSEMFRVLRPGGRLVVLDTDWDSIIWNCSDGKLMDRIFGILTAPYANAHVPRSLTRHLKAAGFEITGRDTFTVLNWEPDPSSYSQQTVGFIKPMMDDPNEFTEEERLAWNMDQAAIAEAGEYMFSLNRYIFSAMKF
jgi:ubiquinone/menaquinone biosynthesis C-methylase UbiE